MPEAHSGARRVHTIAEMAELIGNADATDCGDAMAAARFILTQLNGYRQNASGKGRDTINLANALQAYAYLLQETGVKVVV